MSLWYVKCQHASDQSWTTEWQSKCNLKTGKVCKVSNFKDLSEASHSTFLGYLALYIAKRALVADASSLIVHHRNLIKLPDNYKNAMASFIQHRFTGVNKVPWLEFWLLCFSAKHPHPRSVRQQWPQIMTVLFLNEFFLPSLLLFDFAQTNEGQCSYSFTCWW